MSKLTALTLNVFLLHVVGNVTSNKSGLKRKLKVSSVDIQIKRSVAEFNEFEPRLKSAKNRFRLSTGFNQEKFNTILSETNHR